MGLQTSWRGDAGGVLSKSALDPRDPQDPQNMVTWSMGAWSHMVSLVSFS